MGRVPLSPVLRCMMCAIEGSSLIMRIQMNRTCSSNTSVYCSHHSSSRRGSPSRSHSRSSSPMGGGSKSDRGKYSSRGHTHSSSRGSGYERSKERERESGSRHSKSEHTTPTCRGRLWSGTNYVEHSVMGCPNIDVLHLEMVLYTSVAETVCMPTWTGSTCTIL